MKILLVLKCLLLSAIMTTSMASPIVSDYDLSYTCYKSNGNVDLVQIHLDGVFSNPTKIEYVSFSKFTYDKFYVDLLWGKEITFSTPFSETFFNEEFTGVLDVIYGSRVDRPLEELENTIYYMEIGLSNNETEFVKLGKVTSGGCI
jgi:hypothetical protein